MRKSIFDIENRLDINLEFKTIIELLYKKDTLLYHGWFYSWNSFIDEFVFNLWNYRDTFIDLDSYLYHIGVTDEVIASKKISEEAFLNLLEFLININHLLNKKYKDVFDYNIKIKGLIMHNIPIILEKMNYMVYMDDDRMCLRKRDADVDSILEIVPEDVSLLLLSYNDIRNNNLDAKKDILKGLDLYIEKDKKLYKSFDSKLHDSIGTIVNKMGVNHPVDEEPFINMGRDEIIEWYDKCFKLMIHLIRMKDVNMIKEERANLIKK